MVCRLWAFLGDGAATAIPGGIDTPYHATRLTQGGLDTMLGIHLEEEEFVVRDMSDTTPVQKPGRKKGQTFNQGKEVGRHPTRLLAANQIAESETNERHEVAVAAAKALLGV